MKEQLAPTIRLDQRDNVVLALEDLPAGFTVPKGPTLAEAIPAGHKVASEDIPKSGAIRKYGQIIGFASREIRKGSHVHVHNVELKNISRDHSVGADYRPTQYTAAEERATFSGIVRPDGRIATRNFIGILPTVNCSASTARIIADEFRNREAYPGLDGVVALGHSFGCSMIAGGEAHRLLQRTLAGYARHPNFAGIVLVGLGCEVNQTESLVREMALDRIPNLVAIDIQEAGGTRATVRLAVEAVRSFLPQALAVKRQTVSAEHLVLGLECGGSDAYSGITANPALGFAADLVVKNGGTVILSETPEIYGAEHLLTRRARNGEVAEMLNERIRWWEDYTGRNGGSMDNNPTPGNKAGGITSIWEKSLGAVAKGGNTGLNDIYLYAQEVRSKGLVFMDTPGYDVVSVTGMIAGGANMICFTTGRGTVFGSKPAPTIKLSSNSKLYEQMKDDIDIDCGVVLTGAASPQEAGEKIFRFLLDAASGRKTASEIHELGDFEFVPWHMGATT